MKNIALTIAYDGTRYLGWQKTKEGPSIEAELEKALQQILQHQVTLQAASRTDRGVHADGQVVNFFTQKPVHQYDLRHSMNSLLPEDIRVMLVEEKKESFHPTLDAISKEYHYKIALTDVLHPLLRYSCWHYPFPVDLSLVQQAIPHFLGKKDFSSFRNQRKDLEPEDTIRELFSIDMVKKEQILTLKMCGDNFLYKMARNIAGTLLYVGAKKIALEELSLVFEKKDRTLAGITAPALGLTLHRINYR